jgi:hypothetical protein
MTRNIPPSKKTLQEERAWLRLMEIKFYEVLITCLVVILIILTIKIGVTVLF